ncbi:hypothetical protein [Clostridium cochlearium]|jgi:hypothetical protein|uniref:Uncharacterized protein n=1 Tax=Clostridium cochlearium TaxID=1494 RepID=A0A239Z2G7_CLOCO|nr:hypothetical protein [Clostridium cochlearium]MBV1820565.1 hypothetical protein [Bacteroidales bacterium MSK.15.36]NSJ92061.1 hypothetical protein [Coprococcus sp. MSK.21.13]MBE6065470.1 hypothetical protein [Clostridium cochlearium]MBU5270562.1 hypothetical protein [Clostridium cochlearium]MCG4572830.1 hypothetical protein [Clostridium cochlearium]
MGHRKVINDYYCDIDNLAELLVKLVNSYRLLIGSAGELNSIALAKRSDVKKAIDRANDLGCIIDEVIDGIDKCTYEYIKYCKTKSEIMKYKMKLNIIQTEIESELKFNDTEK